MSWSLVLLLAVLLAALTWFLRRPTDQVPEDPSPNDDDDIDYDVLGGAEAELQDLDVQTSPDEAEGELPDWGPGAPKR